MSASRSPATKRLLGAGVLPLASPRAPSPRSAPPPTGAAAPSPSTPTPRSSARLKFPGLAPPLRHGPPRRPYLFSGVEIRWRSHIAEGDTPTEASFRFPGGLADYLSETPPKGATKPYADTPFAGTVDFNE